MAINRSQELITYGDSDFSLSISPPIRDIKDSEGSATEIFHALTERLTANSAGIAKCIDSCLELDYRAYSVYVAGSGIELSRVDGLHSGYSIHISVYPRFTFGDNEENG